MVLVRSLCFGFSVTSILIWGVTPEAAIQKLFELKPFLLTTSLIFAAKRKGALEDSSPSFRSILGLSLPLCLMGPCEFCFRLDLYFRIQPFRTEW